MSEKSVKIIILERILKVMAKAVLSKYRPTVIGITGSVGKTSAKEAVFSALSGKFNVRKNEKNYNNEIGIPLTILGEETGGRSLQRWIEIFWRWLKLLIERKEYPEIIVLEMGVDRPGDMEYLLTIVRPTIGVVTNISSSHLEYFESLDHIAKEKGKLIEVLPKNGFAILNSDDARVARMASRTKAHVFATGFGETASVCAENCTYHYEGDMPDGLSFKLNYNGKSLPIRLQGILARHQVNAVLFGIAAGIAMKMNLVEISDSLAGFKSPIGRLNLIEGINESLIIDDSYNASPTSTIAAIGVLAELKTQGRRIAALGDMLELGKDEEKGHVEVGKALFENKIDFVVVVGKRMEYVSGKLHELGHPKQDIVQFSDPIKAGEYLAKIVAKGDIVLVKGSQGMRMEKVAEFLLSDPGQAKKKLPRQTKEWKKKPFMNP